MTVNITLINIVGIQVLTRNTELPENLHIYLHRRCTLMYTMYTDHQWKHPWRLFGSKKLVDKVWQYSDLELILIILTLIYAQEVHGHVK